VNDEPGLKRVPCTSFRAPGPAEAPGSGERSSAPRRLTRGEDFLAVEEPLELRIGGEPVATVMRTPGNDRELAVGFLFNEGWISGVEEIGALSLCSSGENPGIGNVADLIPAAGRAIAWKVPPRLSPVTASCGVCGKRTIEEVLATVPPLRRSPAAESAPLRARALERLPAALRSAQILFQRTGALHAAGLFDREGRLLLLREDVGRHNAVDKVVGACVLLGQVTLRERVLLVSGRASFEIVQKALRAGVPTVAAISGVSSLASELAEAGGVTLVGFLRDGSFQTYSHPERIVA
jgi:FdhD protein